MATGNSTVDHALSLLGKSMRHRLWLVDALWLGGAILAGVIVGIGVFGQRFRYHGLTRFIFLGATTLYLPVMSTVVPMVAGSKDYVSSGLAAKCDPGIQSIMVVMWASLVQIIMINTSAIVVVDDKEGRNIGLPFELLVQGSWTLYLGITYLFTDLAITDVHDREDLEAALTIFGCEVIPFALICAKMLFKYYAFENARRSFALGKNPHLIFAYMKQPRLQQQATSYYRREEAATDDEGAPPPPLLVVGEGKRHMEKQYHGYVWKGDTGTIVHGKDGLVTIDSVWKMKAYFSLPTLQRLQDLCLSFAFFKLLRCRFAWYNINTANASTDMHTFYWSLLLKEGDHNHNRVFQLISDEISFVHDYYYSSIPISYSKCWLPIVGIFISFLTISYCICVAIILSLYLVGGGNDDGNYQLRCDTNFTPLGIIHYGNWLLGLLPLCFLLVLVCISEVRDMAIYFCSDWSKVALVCRLLNCSSCSASSTKHSLCIQKCAALLLRCRCKLLWRHWDEKIGQCSVLVLQTRTTPLGVLWELFPLLPDQNRRVMVPAAVKVCIIQALRRTRNNGGQLSNGAACLRHHRGQLGERILWACSNKSTSHTILTWHIATSILEVRYPHLHDENKGSQPLSNTDYKMVATYLTRYCAYLITWCPELLPDDHEWSRSLYEDVKKDAEHVIGGFTTRDSVTPEDKCQQLVKLLSTKAKHQVVKEGAKLGKQLAELVLEDGDDTAWMLLAEFWSEMILYVAPSDNLKGHKEVIARGGELITLLWVMLFHVGIISRPDEHDDAALAAATSEAATSTADVV